MTLNKIISSVMLASALVGCVSQPIDTSSSRVAAVSSVAAITSSLASSSSSLAPSSSSVAFSRSSVAISSSSLAISSSSMVPVLSTFTVEENQAGFCQYDGMISTVHTGFGGAGYTDSANAAGADINWSINAQTAGNYTLRLRYSNGGTATRAATVNVNNVRAATTTFLTAALWTDWQTLDVSISLMAGKNSLQLVADDAAGLANIDAISVIGRAGVSAAACTELPAENSVGFYPAINANNINPDVRLRLSFDATPTMAGTGTVQIMDASNNSVVDTIKIGVEKDELGVAGASNLRVLNTKMIVQQGKTIEITPHTNKLAYGKTYNVVIANNVFKGAIAGQTYNGNSGSSWQFKTKSTGPSATTVTVDDDAAADFSSVQGALNYMMKDVSGSANGVINVRKGTYNEVLFLRNKSNLRIVGEGRDSVTIKTDNADFLNPGSGKSGAAGSAAAGGRSLFLIEGGDLVSIENLTIFNTHTRSSGSTGHQAETVYFNSSSRLVAKNAAFISEQDTLLLKGYSWFYNSLVAGNVDFIWGYANAALFENSEIRSLGDSNGGGSSTSGGYILQARVASTGDNGFIFLNSSLTRAKGPAGNSIPDGKTYLARSGFSSSATNYDNFAFINCKMDKHIASLGWFDESSKGKVINPSVGTATYGYREYGSTDLAGNVLNLNSRQGAYKLNSSDFNKYYANRALIFAKYNNGAGWNPQP